MHNTSPIFNGIAAFLTGILSGCGIGGGTLLMIYLTIFADVEQRIAQFVNLIYFLPTAMGAMLPHFKNKCIDIKTAIPTALSGGVFAYLTAACLPQIDGGILKRIFGLFLLCIGIKEMTAKR